MNIDSDNDQPMHTPATNSPPSSGDERSPPSTPPTRTRVAGGSMDMNMFTQVSEILADNEDLAEVTGKKKREEREWQVAAQAEWEKLLDKEWRDDWLKRWTDDSIEVDMKPNLQYRIFPSSTSNTAVAAGVGGSSKGKEPEK